MKENRKNKRINIALDTAIELASGLKITGKTINMSFGGILAVFPESDNLDDININDTYHHLLKINQ